MKRRNFFEWAAAGGATLAAPSLVGAQATTEPLRLGLLTAKTGPLAAGGIDILRLLRELNRMSGTSVRCITHNMGVVASLCDRVVIMDSGRVVEQGPVDTIFATPRHPCTWALLNAVPRLDRPKGGRLSAIPGQAPDPASPQPGCRFAPRCPHAVDRCREAEPADEQVGEGHSVRCWVQPVAMETSHAGTR